MPAGQLSLDFGPHRSFLDRQAANEASGHMSLFKARERDAFYRSKGWRRARGAVLARDGARCCKCGRTAHEVSRLDVDHIIPRATAPHLALVLSNLQVLCEPCHEAKTYRESLRLSVLVHSVGHRMRS